jgi:hypothetical protein
MLFGQVVAAVDDTYPQLVGVPARVGQAAG